MFLIKTKNVQIFECKGNKLILFVIFKSIYVFFQLSFTCCDFIGLIYILLKIITMQRYSSPILLIISLSQQNYFKLKQYFVHEYYQHNFFLFLNHATSFLRNKIF